MPGYDEAIVKLPLPALGERERGSLDWGGGGGGGDWGEASTGKTLMVKLAITLLRLTVPYL